MNLMWLIYAVDTLTPSGGMFVLTILLVIASIVITVIGAVAKLPSSGKDEDSKAFLKYCPFKTMYAVTAVMFLYCTLAPSKDTAYKMVAAYGVQTVAENPDVKRLAGKSLEVLERAMDEYTKKGGNK